MMESVGNWCLLLLGTLSYLRYFRGSVLAHLFIWFVIPTWILRQINNNHFNSDVDLIHPNELEIRDTTEYSASVSYLDALLKLDTNGTFR
jgi:hypothetical protein